MIRVVSMYTKIDQGVPVDTTSRSGVWSQLSPFKLGPCQLYGDYVSLTHENAWQYAKVYNLHVDPNGDPIDLYWEWARAGWNNPRAVRYPMGKGAIPLYSFWEGRKLSYIEARKAIYAPLYIRAVRETAAFERLTELFKAGELIVLRDYDGYDYSALGLTLSEVLNNSKKKMGHAFVLAMLLSQDPALNELVGV
jgi:hypothetical protein